MYPKQKTKMLFKVVCIDDSNRPDGIPTSKWVKKGSIYTVIQIMKMRMQGGMLGFKLDEINLDEYFPYQYFAANRFAIAVGDASHWAQKELDRLLEEAKKEAAEEPIAT